MGGQSANTAQVARALGGFAESLQWGDVTSIAAPDKANWAVVNGNSLWLTTDAGATWRSNDHALDPRCSFDLVDFIDRTSGLASGLCTSAPGVMDGCEHTAEYKSDWDFPPIGNSMFFSRDAGKTWTDAAKPILK